MARQNQLDKKFLFPSKNTARRLLVALDAFVALEPWRWMGDREVVAVRDPQSERIAYCVVMGAEGICCGLDAMLGDRGLVAYHEAVLNDIEEPDIDFLYQKDSLTVFLENKNMLELEDLAFCKAAGVSYPTLQGWPQFRRFEPGFFPWLFQENDAVFMSVCLEQVVDVARRAKDNPDILGPGDYYTFLARTPVQTTQGTIWQEAFISPQPLKRVIQITPKWNKVLLEQVFSKAQKTEMVWEAECFIGQLPIRESDGRPRFPFCYMMADQESGFILHMNLADAADHGADFLNQICEAVRKNRVFPKMICIRQAHLASVFAPLAVFGITTQVVQELPMLDYARDELNKAFKKEGGPFKDSSSKSKRKVKKSKVVSKKNPSLLGQSKVLEFKVVLNNIQPAIWRRFQVKSGITLKRLAATLILVMEWDNCHLHQFCIGKKKYSIPCEDYSELDDFEDEGEFRLGDFSVDELRQFVFEYDFGDGWEHAVFLEKVLAPQKGTKYPLCLAGERSCPPDDCGGPWGYEKFLEIIRNPDHPEYAEKREWLGGDFDPEQFDIDIINRGLRHVASEESFFDEG
jgi:hypothetical protein